MEDEEVNEFYDKNKKRRVIILRRENGTFYYEEEFLVNIQKKCAGFQKLVK
jgi:hypothetical protein